MSFWDHIAESFQAFVLNFSPSFTDIFSMHAIGYKEVLISCGDCVKQFNQFQGILLPNTSFFRVVLFKNFAAFLPVKLQNCHSACNFPAERPYTDKDAITATIFSVNYRFCV